MAKRQRFIDLLLAQIGDPYVWGAEGPNAFDCSGLVSWALQEAGFGTGRNTAQGFWGQYGEGDVSRSALKIGDLVFFNYGRLPKGQADHVGVYVGGGKIVAASSSSDNVRVYGIDWDHYIGAGRVNALSGAASVPKTITSKKASVGPKPVVSEAELSSILRGFGLSPQAFDDLIDEAIREDWTMAEFEANLYLSEEFVTKFPGIFRGDGSLKMSPLEYRELADEFRKVGRDFDIKVTDARIGYAISNDKSVVEFGHLAEIYKATRKSDEGGFREAFNTVLRAEGHEPMSISKWFKFLAGMDNADLYDTYEAAFLRNAGLNVGGKGTQSTSQIGKPGEFIDLNALVAQIKAVKDFVAPELTAAGVSDADLAILEGGTDPKGQRQLLEQILRNRAALTPIGRPSALSTPTGQAALFPAVSEGL
jgi:hypothetical protein